MISVEILKKNVIYRTCTYSFVQVLFIVCFFQQSFCQNWEAIQVQNNCVRPIAIYFIDNKNGFIILESTITGGPGVSLNSVILTADGGYTWSISTDTSNAYLFSGRKPNSIYSDSSGQVFMDIGGLFLQSSNYGKTWVIKGSVSGKVNTGLVTSNCEDYKLVTNNSLNVIYVLVSKDTGSTYDFSSEPYELPNQTYLNSACFIDSARIWCTLNTLDTNVKPICMKTNNSGITWDFFYPYDTSSFFFFGGIKPGVVDGSIFLTNNYFKPNPQSVLDLLYTTDTGTSWVSSMSLKGTMVELHNSKKGTLWAVLSDSETVAFSDNNGLDWIYDSTTFDQKKISTMYWKDSTKGYILTYADSNISLFKYIQKNSVKSNSNAEVYADFTPRVIHGNTLEYRADKQEEFFLEIFSLLGNKVFENTTISHNNKILIDVSNFPVGYYFLRVRYSHGLLLTRFIKM